MLSIRYQVMVDCPLGRPVYRSPPSFLALPDTPAQTVKTISRVLLSKSLLFSSYLDAMSLCNNLGFVLGRSLVEQFALLR